MHVNPFTARERPATAALCAIAVALLLSVGACGDNSGDNAGATATPGDTNASTTGGAPSAAWATARRPPARRSRSARSSTKQPGTDFTDITNIAKAYFDCVNDNGGINGQPIEYLSRPSRPTRRRSPRWPRSSSRATRSSAIVGNTRIIECAVNHKY